MKRALLVFIIAAGLLVWIGADTTQARYHIVQKGDTIYSIAKKYDVPADAIMTANSITDPKSLKIGQKLLIPAVYVVSKGDTLYSIARRFSVSVEALFEINKYPKGKIIKPGDVVVLPPDAKIPSPTPVSPDEGPEAVPTGKGILDPSIGWPAQGEARYLDGKVLGVIVKAKKGADVKSVCSGRVIFVGPYRGYGTVVFVQGPGGLVYIYGGNEDVCIVNGDRVTVGSKLGTVGNDLKTGYPSVYFFVFKGNIAVDPAKAPRY